MKNSYPVLTILAVLLSIAMFCACDRVHYDIVVLANPNMSQKEKCATWKLFISWESPDNPCLNSVLEIIQKNEDNLKLYETFNAVGDMQLRSAKTKYKYKKQDPEKAQQGWTMKGEFDTPQDSLSEFTLIRIQAGCGTGDTSSQIDHQFTPDKVSKNGKSCKAKFKYYPDTVSKNGKTPKSAGHSWPSFGLFSARIKDGKLRFVYNIKKAKEGDQIITNGFDSIGEIWGQMGDTNKVESAGFVNTKVNIGTDEKKADSMIKLKATKKGIKGKIKPSEQF